MYYLQPNSTTANNGLEDNDYWNAASMEFFSQSQVKKEIDSAVKFTGRLSTGRFNGSFPSKYIGLVSPSNVHRYYHTYAGTCYLKKFLLSTLYLYLDRPHLSCLASVVSHPAIKKAENRRSTAKSSLKMPMWKFFVYNKRPILLNHCSHS